METPYTRGPYAGVAQLAEQLIRNQQVGGSSPLAGTNRNSSLYAYANAFFPRG